MFYNHTKAELNETQKTIKKLNQRYTDLTKKGLGNLPQAKEYEELFKKIGGDENTRVQKSGNINLSTNKKFIDELTKDDLKKLDELDKKYLTVGHITAEKAEKIKEKSEKPLTFKQAEKMAKKSLKKEVFNQSVYDNLGLIYSDNWANSLMHRGFKTKAEINRVCDLLGIEKIYTQSEIKKQEREMEENEYNT